MKTETNVKTEVMIPEETLNEITEILSEKILKEVE